MSVLPRGRMSHDIYELNDHNLGTSHPVLFPGTDFCDTECEPRSRPRTTRHSRSSSPRCRRRREHMGRLRGISCSSCRWPCHCSCRQQSGRDATAALSACTHAAGAEGDKEGGAGSQLRIDKGGGWLAGQNRQGLLSQLTARNVAPKKEAARRATQGENCGSQKLAYTQMKVTADHLR